MCCCPCSRLTMKRSQRLSCNCWVLLLVTLYLRLPIPRATCATCTSRGIPAVALLLCLLCSVSMATGLVTSTEHRSIDNSSLTAQRSWINWCPTLNFRVVLLIYRIYDYDYMTYTHHYTLATETPLYAIQIDLPYLQHPLPKHNNRMLNAILAPFGRTNQTASV